MISDGDIRTALRAFLVSNCGVPAASCVRGFGNRAPMPKGSFVTMSLMLDARTATNISDEQGDLDQNGAVAEFSETTIMPSQGSMQLDFYGEDAWAWANKAAMYLRDGIGCAFLDPYGVQPLYCNDPKNLTGVSGEAQYLPRWMLEAVLAFNQSDTRTVDYFTNVVLHTKPEL
jgi:hypothetical protein